MESLQTTHEGVVFLLLPFPKLPQPRGQIMLVLRAKHLRTLFILLMLIVPKGLQLSTYACHLVIHNARRWTPFVLDTLMGSGVGWSRGGTG